MEQRGWPVGRGLRHSLLPLGFVAVGRALKHDAHPRVRGLLWARCGLVPLKTSAQGSGGERPEHDKPQFVCHAG